MNSKKRGIIVLCFICVISMIFTVTVYAKDAPPKNIEMVGGAKGLIHVPNDDLFLSNLNMIPGSYASGTISIKNTDDIPYRLSLRAEQVTHGEMVGNEIIDILDHINLKITYNGDVIFNDYISKMDDEGEEISLGSYNPNSTGLIEAIAVLDSDVGNEYKDGRYGEVKWIFTAVADEVPNEDSPEVNNLSGFKAISTVYKTADSLLIVSGMIFFISLITIIIKFCIVFKKTKQTMKNCSSQRIKEEGDSNGL